MNQITINAEAIIFDDNRSLANLLRVIGDTRQMDNLTLSVCDRDIRSFADIIQGISGIILEQLLPVYALSTYRQVVNTITTIQDEKFRNKQTGEATIRKELEDHMALLDASYYQQTDEFRALKKRYSAELEGFHRLLAVAEAKTKEIRKDEFEAISLIETAARQKVLDHVAEYAATPKKSILEMDFSEYQDSVREYQSFLAKKKTLEQAEARTKDHGNSQREVVMGSDAYIAAHKQVCNLRDKIAKAQSKFDYEEKQIKERFVATSKKLHEQRTAYRTRYISGIVSANDSMAVPKKKAYTILTLMIDPTWKP